MRADGKSEQGTKQETRERPRWAWSQPQQTQREGCAAGREPGHT